MTEDEATREHQDQELFDRIAQKYLRKDLKPASRLARRLRLLQTVADLPLTPTTRLLEIGCGAGYSAEYLDGYYGAYSGLDYSAELITLAERRNGGEAREFQTINLFDYNPAQKFDVIIMIGVLHHMTDPAAAVRRIYALLEPGGWFAANEPASSNPVVGKLRRMRKTLDADYSDDQIEMSAEQGLELLRAGGFEEIAVMPQGIISTPFAEVVLAPQFLSLPLAKVACRLDTLLEKAPSAWRRVLSWNIVLHGKKPLESSSPS